MAYEAYPVGLVRRLLEHIPCCLQYGRWPGYHGDYDLPRETLGPGYRGRVVREVGGYEVAIEALVDLEQAVARLDGRTRLAVRRRFWEGKRPAPGEPAYHELVWMVWQEI